jgi:hypothetical protein
VDAAPLQRRLRQVVAHGVGQTGVGVGDDQLHPRQAAIVELGQQVAPGGLRFLRADGDRQELPVPVQADAVGHQRRDVLNLPRPAGVEEGGVQEEVRDRASDGRLPKVLDLGAQRLRGPAHGGAAHVLTHERLGDLADVPRRGAVHVGGHHGVVDVGAPALVPLEHATAGGAALARARHLEVDGAHRSDEPAEVRPVPTVDPLGLALPLLGTDQGTDLLLQDDLQGDPDRALAEGAQIRAEVLLRRQFKLGNLVHRKLLGLAAKRGLLVFGHRGASTSFSASANFRFTQS